MSSTGQILDKNLSLAIEMLADIPRPSGDCNGTITFDYGQKMVYQQPRGRASFFEQDAKQNFSITTICTAIGEAAIENHLMSGAMDVGLFTGEITTGASFVIYPATATSPVSRDSLTLKSIENWIPKNAVRFDSLKFEVTDEILRFCYNHEIVKYLRPVISLIEECFSSFYEPYLEIEEDPESDREWITFGINIKGEVKEGLEHYNNYVTQFVSKVPWPEREKFRLSYNII